MLRNEGERKGKNIRKLFIGTITIMFITVSIVLLVVFSPNKALAEGSLDRIECPGFDSEDECIKHDCSFEPVQRGPSCYMKKDDYGFTLSEIKKIEKGYFGTLKSKTKETPYGISLSDITVEVDYVTENILRVKLRDSNRKRFEVPVQQTFSLLENKIKVDPNKLAYNIVFSDVSQKFNYKIQRHDGTVLWDTSIGGMIMSDKYLQIASYLPSNYIFGLGEHTRETLRHDLNFSSWPMFSRDEIPERGQINLYGSHPYYTCLEKNGKSHGVLLLNSNAMEVTVMPSPAISFRTIGGVLDLFYFIGDGPEHVVQLYTSLIGRPMMPPYWGLGFQLSRYGYNKLENVKTVIERTRAAKIPHDVQYLDIDSMDGNKDFTYNQEDFKGLTEYVKETKEKYGLKWITIIDPAIAAGKDIVPYVSGVKDNVFARRSPSWDKNMFSPSVRDTNFVYGKVWPSEVVAFPDFFQDKTQEWWINNLVEYRKLVEFDGLWIDMNEPANFGTNEENPSYCNYLKDPKDCWSLKCPKSDYEDPPYNPLKQGGRLSTKTICMETVQGTGNNTYLHYDVHSLYGWSESRATKEAAEISTGTRSLVISRSTYPSSGRYAGHWLGDNRSFWRDMHDSVIGMLEFNLYGIPYIGADGCGFNDDTTPELCSRWMQLGAFYPFFRNHNGKGMKDQDPASLGDDVIDKSRKAVERRYKLNPYLYTLFYRAHVDGNTVVRPVFHEFPSDQKTWNIDEQFMWGKCLLVSPILREGENNVNVYLPNGEWWNFDFANSNLETSSGQQSLTKSVTDYIPVHVRGGCIIPTEDIQLRTPSKNEVRNISLYIYPENRTASGELFVDDGLSKGTVEEKKYDLYRYQMKDCELNIERDDGAAFEGSEPILKQIIVFKVVDVANVKVNLNRSSDFTYNKDKKILTINVKMEMKFTKKITWGDKDNNCQLI